MTRCPWRAPMSGRLWPATSRASEDVVGVRAIAAVMAAAASPAMMRGARVMVSCPCSVEEGVDVAAGAAVQGQVDGDAGGARYLTMRKAVVALALAPPAMARAVIVRL